MSSDKVAVQQAWSNELAPVDSRRDPQNLPRPRRTTREDWSSARSRHKPPMEKWAAGEMRIGSAEALIPVIFSYMRKNHSYSRSEPHLSAFARPTALCTTKSFCRKKIEDAPFWAPRLPRDRDLGAVEENDVQ
jgi:hypothetical protein